MQTGPAAGLMQQVRRGDDADACDERADGDIHVGHGGHAGECGSNDDEDRDDVGAELRRDGIREDEVKNVAAAFELIAGDADVGKKNGEGSEDAGGLVVACFEKIRQRELGEFAGSRSNEIDEQEAEPSAGRLPQSGESIFVGVFGSGEQGAGADPGSQQREYENERREASAQRRGSRPWF